MYKSKIMTPEGIAYLKTSSRWYDNALTLLAAQQWEDALAYMVNESPVEKLMGWLLQRLPANTTEMEQCSKEIELWLHDHDDSRRWHIFMQAEQLGFATPLGALGLSLFWMQGSMTPAEFGAVYPEEHLSALMLLCALKLLSVSLAANESPMTGAQTLISEWNNIQGGN